MELPGDRAGSGGVTAELLNPPPLPPLKIVLNSSSRALLWVKLSG